jgi:transposase InsO family protein
LAIDLLDTLCLPGTINLLSVSRLTSAGHAVHLDGPEPHLRLLSGSVVPLQQRHGLFWLTARTLAASPTRPVPAPDDSKASALHVLTKLTPTERHGVLGHMSEADMRKIGWLQASEHLPFCDACATGKAKRQAVPKQAAPRVTAVGQLTHSDICGPMEVASLSGKRYVVNFIDDATRYTTVYLMRTKNEVLQCWQQYVRFMATLGVHLGPGCTLQSDNDTVYRSQAFTAWTMAKGIAVRYSAPHTQAQNGVAERNWNSIVDSARTMLRAAGLPNSYWGLAIQHAACIRNMAPSSVLHGGTPFERLMGRLPDYDCLQPFGCPAFVHVPDAARKRWDAKARQGIYVGFNLNSPSYLVYYSDSNRVVDAYHVVFNPAGKPAPSAPPAGAADEGVMSFGSSAPVAPAAGPQPESSDDEPASPAEPAQPDPLLADLPTPNIVSESDSETSSAASDHSDPGDPLFNSFEEYGNLARASIVSALASHALPMDPRSYAEAMASPQASNWTKATLEECKSIMENRTFSLVPRSKLPDNAKPLRSMFIYKTKLDSKGNVDRFKARLVVKGCGQRKGIDYDEVFAPVAHHQTIRVVLAVAACQGLRVEQMDVTTAFLIPEISEEIYMELPDGWPADLPGGGRDGKASVAKLNKAIYGLKQAPRCWYDKLSKWLIDRGFQRSLSEPCLFLHQASAMYVTVYVDDLLILCASETAIASFKADISAAFRMKDLGLAHFCLGMRFLFSDGQVTMDQQRYIGEILERNGMAACNPAVTPLPPGTELAKAASDSELLPADKASTYREIVGSLLYLVVCTRPDIAMATNQLSRHMATPTQTHLGAAKHVLRYLRGTSSLGLAYSRPASRDQRNIVLGYADSSWQSVPGTSRSVSGYVFMLNGAAVSWRCKVQTIIAMSTAEAEFDALSMAAREAIYLRGLLGEMQLAQPGPTVMNEDNQPCIQMAKNPVTSSRVKHAVLRFNFVRECLEAKHIDIVYCPTEDMLADAFTKILPRPAFSRLRALIMGCAV